MVCRGKKQRKPSLHQTNPFRIFLALLTRRKPNLTDPKLKKMANNQWRRMSEKKKYRYILKARKEAQRRAAKRRRCVKRKN